MYSIPPSEKLIETRTCKQCGGDFPITDKDLEFYEKVSPVFNGIKCAIPAPTLCPDCRNQRRLSFRNLSKLYKRKCSATGKDIVSIYSPDKPYKVYSQEEWWSDHWSPTKYGRDFDFTKPFFEQFKSLMAEVPRIALLNGFSENADYGNHSYHNKNSYLVNSCSYVENSYFCTYGTELSDCIDTYRLYHSEHCTYSTDSFHCQKCQYIQLCEDCTDCLLCFHCSGCKNCIGCKNLTNKEYHVFNLPVSREEYKKVLSDYRNNPIRRQEIRERFEELKQACPSRNLWNVSCEQLHQSDNCENSNEIKHCFDCFDSRNIAYSSDITTGGATDCYDYDIWGENAHRVYEVHCTGGNVSDILFSNVIWGGRNVYYSDYCLNNAQNVFGCIGLHNNESYCILNKQYTKDEYEALVPKIIEHMKKTGEWGEFFPSQLSPYGYNETTAEWYFPLKREKALQEGFHWSDYEAPFPKVEKIIPASKLPDAIEDVPDDILNWAIECEVTGKPFRIIKQELEFYRKHGLPIPRRHPDQRQADLMTQRNPRRLFERVCGKCGAEMLSTYATEKPEKVYCEKCYDSEIA